ncbi:uncharacterized protein [Dysidea avara]|uniref:uncharacterized protein n=1 Tax=Dysidea avara TaxID=196820 RepID=UPI0033204CCE
MENSQLTLNSSNIYEELLQKATNSASLVIINLSKLGTPECSIVAPLLEVFCETLTEITAVWMSDDKGKIDALLSGILSNPNLLEMLFTFIFKSTKIYSRNAILKNGMIIAAKVILNSVQANHEVRYKVLSSGLLLTQVSSLEILSHMLGNNEAAVLLSGIHLQLLHCCFVDSPFYFMYAFYEIEWFNILNPLVNCHNKTVYYMAKFVACHLFIALSESHKMLFELSSVDVSLLLGLLNTAASSNESNVKLAEANISLTTFELLQLLSMFTLHSSNRSVIASDSTILPTLATLLVSASVLEKTTTCLFILKLAKAKEFRSAFLLSELPFSDILQVFLDEGNDEWINCLIDSTINVNLQTLCVTQLQTLHKICLQFESSLESNAEKNYDLVDSLCKLLEIVHLNIADCQVYDKERNVQRIIAVLATIVTKLLRLIGSKHDKLLSCLPPIMYHILNWINPQSGFTDHILVKHVLGEVVHQLKLLATFECTWFTEFFVKANLGIIISILNDDSFSSFSGDINWVALLKRWLKFESQDIKVAAMLIGCCLADQFIGEGSLLKPRENDEKFLLGYLEECVESKFLGVPICNNLYTLTLKVLIMSLQNRLEYLKVIYKPMIVFKTLKVILQSNRNTEIQQICRFLCTYGKHYSLDQLVCDYDSLLTKLVGTCDGENGDNIQAAVANALHSLQGYPLGDIDESDNQRDKLLCNAVRIIASILKCLNIEQINFNSPNVDGTQLQLSLTEMWHAFKHSSDTSSINTNEHLIAAVDSMCLFVEKVIKRICVSRKMVDQAFLNCLSHSLALMALWSNENIRIRFQIMRTELLVHLGNFITFLDTSEDKSFEVLNVMMMNAATIFCNCVKEKDFAYLYTLPGVANWRDAIQAWMESNYLPLYFKAKVIYGFMAHNLEKEELFPLFIKAEHLDELLETILQAATSESFVGSLFEWKFHIVELIASLYNFVLLEANFLQVIQISSVSVSLLLIFNYGNNAERKGVCRLLLVLLQSPEFAEEMKSLGLVQVLEDQVKSCEDSCLKFLSQIIITMQNRQNAAQNVKECFDQLLHFICHQVTILLQESEDKCIKMFYQSLSHCQLVEAIEEMYLYWRRSPLSMQAALMEVIIAHDDYLQALHSFLNRAFKALCREEQLLGFCFIKLSMCLLSWAQRSTQFCQKILQMGLLLDYIKVISKSSVYAQTNFNTFVIAIYLHIILQCVKEVDMQAYLHDRNWFQLFSQLASSANQEFCIVSKLITGFLIHLFSESEYEAFRFNSQEAKVLVNLLNKCAVKGFSKEERFNFEIPLLCLLDALIYIFSVSYGDDGTLLNALESDGSVIMSIMQMLKFYGENIKTGACGLLWILLERSSIVTLSSNSTVCELRTELSSLKSSDIGQHLVYLIDSVCTMLQNDCEIRVDAYKVKANSYYVLKNFSQCVKLCDEAIKLYNPLKHDFLVLKGKALYFSYVETQRKLNKSMLTEDVKKRLYDDCYSINKQCIQLLGDLYDEGLLQEGEQEFMMLNRAMMDCIFQANQLDSCARCYLCLNNPQNVFFSGSTSAKKDYSNNSKQATTDLGFPTSPPSDVTFRCDTATDEPTKHHSKKRKLIKSHTISKSVLQGLSTYEVGKDKRTLYAPGTSIKVAQKRLISPGEMVYYMLCHDCEELLSRHGETQFLPDFIKKIHTGTNKQKIEPKELFIDYGPWLYQFCVGLIFRTMYLDAKDFVNSTEVMKVLHDCRTYLLSLLNHEVDIELHPPLIHIFISPSSVGIEEIGGSYMTVFLQDGFYSMFGQDDCCHGNAVSPTFFVKKISVVNICVSIAPNSLSQQFSQFAINKTGGVYWVPPESKRRENFPAELWSVYQKSSKQVKQIYNPSNIIMTASITKEYVLDSRNAKKQNTSSPLITDSVHRTLSLKKIDLVSTSVFLPPQFAINHAKRQLILPKGHTVLLHANYIRGHKMGSTFFVAIGNDKVYSPSKPYVLWYFYEPDSIVSGGAFFSLDTLEVKKFLFDDSRLPDRMPRVDFLVAREKIPSVLKDLVQDKGFSSIQSLLYRVASSLDKHQSLPHFDTKCKKDAECWYCRTLCQNCCQREAAFGRTAHACDGTVLFCSKHCQDLSPEHYKSMEIFDLCTMEIPSYIFIHCAPLSSSHTTLQHVFIRKLNNMNFPCEIEIAVCVGDGTEGCPTNKPYVVFYSHHLFHQLFLEFFINSQLIAEEPLPHSINENAWKYILKLNDAKALLKCLDIANVAELLLLQIHEVTNC